MALRTHAAPRAESLSDVATYLLRFPQPVSPHETRGRVVGLAYLDSMQTFPPDVNAIYALIGRESYVLYDDYVHYLP